MDRTMAMPGSSSNAFPWSAISGQHLIPPEELTSGEYIYRVHLNLTHTGYSKKRSPKFKYEVDIVFFKIICGLLNTSGGIIYLIPRFPEKPLGTKELGQWRNEIRDKLLSFVPDSVYQQCIFMEHVSIIVHKSKQFITSESHMYTRGISETIQASHYDIISELVSQEARDTSGTIPIAAPFIYSKECLLCTETKNVEFKHFTHASISQLVDKIGKGRALKSLFGMANLDTGGYVVLGIKEDELTKVNTYLGQTVEETEESDFRSKLTHILTYDEQGNRRIWGNTHTTPKEGEQWVCQFIPLINPPVQHIAKRLVLIVIRVFHCPGGMFEHCPDASVITDDGHVDDLGFEEWHLKHNKKVSKTTPLNLVSRLPTTTSPAADQLEQQTLAPEAVLEDNATLTYTVNSSKWVPSELDRKNAYCTKNTSASKLFTVGEPIHYKPDRISIEGVLSNTDLLPFIDQTVGKPACGIAADTLWKCIRHVCSSLYQMKPQHHIMDLLVLDELASICLFVVNQESENADQIKVQHLYSMMLTRILKRRILEAMPPDSDFHLVQVRCAVINLDDVTKPSWTHQQMSSSSGTLPGRIFHDVCLALDKILSNMPTWFRDSITADEDVNLSTQQNHVLEALDNKRFSIVEGSPGSGKTIIAQRFCEQKGIALSAYISASRALTVRANYGGKIEAHYATNSVDIVKLVSGILKDKKHIIVDDNHSFSYSEKDLHAICSVIAKEKRHLHVFQDTRYQNYLQVTEPKLFQTFVLEHRSTYGSVVIEHMNVNYRNTKVVLSFLKGQISKLTQGNDADELKCGSNVLGSDIIIKQLKNLRHPYEDNGLLKHIRQLVTASVEINRRHYSFTDIAILVDNDDVNLGEREVTFVRKLFQRFWPEIHIQDAEDFPVKGLIVDRLENFKGLDSSVVIFMVPKNGRFTEDDQERLNVNTMYRIAIASRGIDRVEFLHEDNITGRIAGDMNIDRCSPDYIKSSECGGSGVEHESIVQCPEDVRSSTQSEKSPANHNQSPPPNTTQYVNTECKPKASNGCHDNDGSIQLISPCFSDTPLILGSLPQAQQTHQQHDPISCDNSSQVDDIKFKADNDCTTSSHSTRNATTDDVIHAFHKAPGYERKDTHRQLPKAGPLDPISMNKDLESIWEVLEMPTEESWQSVFAEMQSTIQSRDIELQTLKTYVDKHDEQKADYEQKILNQSTMIEMCEEKITGLENTMRAHTRFKRQVALQLSILEDSNLEHHDIDQSYGTSTYYSPEKTLYRRDARFRSDSGMSSYSAGSAYSISGYHDTPFDQPGPYVCERCEEEFKIFELEKYLKHKEQCCNI